MMYGTLIFLAVIGVVVYLMMKGGGGCCGGHDHHEDHSGYGDHGKPGGDKDSSHNSCCKV